MTDRKSLRNKKYFAGLLLLFIFITAGILLTFVFGDTQITHSLRTFALENPKFLKGAEFITEYGNRLYYLLFIGLFIYGVVKKEKKFWRVSLIYLVVQIIASVFFAELLKAAVGRPRPGYGLTHRFFSGRFMFKSFPSGHATDAFSSAGVLWGFLSSYTLSFISFFFSLLIGFSRIFVGMHYYLDVIAGMALGFITGIFITYKLLKH